MLESYNNVYYWNESNSNKEMRGYKLSIFGFSEVMVRFRDVRIIIGKINIYFGYDEGN